MAAVPFPDLPPIPKSLSALAGSSNNQWKEMQRLYAMKATLQVDLEMAASPVTSASCSQSTRVPAASAQLTRSLSGSDKSASNFNLGAAVSLLRKEMSSLRQLDASLFCQLMLVNDTMSELKAAAAAAAAAAADGPEDRERPLSTDTLDAFSEYDEVAAYDSSGGEEALSDSRPLPPLPGAGSLRLLHTDSGPSGQQLQQQQQQQQPSDVQVIKLRDGKKIYLLKRETLC